VLTALLLVSLAQARPVKVQQDGVQLGGGWWGTLNCVAPVTCERAASTGVVSITSSGGGGGGAPTTAEYVTAAAHAGLSAERVLSAGNYTVIDNATTAQSQVDWVHGLTCSAGQALTSSGTTAMACTSTITASDVACAGTCIADAEIAAVSGAKVSGAVATATALAANPTDCSAGQYATTIAASGNLTCAQVAYSQLSGTPTLPSWTNVDVDFGTVAKRAVTQSVTDAAVSSSSKIILQQLGIAPSGRQADEAEMDSLLCRAIPASGSFKLICTSLEGSTHGTHRVVYQVN
jgi:hypothetical protein